MFIRDVVKEIWEPVSKKFNEEYERAVSLSALDLYRQVENDEMAFYQYPRTHMNLFNTCGCSYSTREGYFAGCSMCDYQPDTVVSEARLKALREKDPYLYGKALCKSFKNVRGSCSEPSLFELFSSYDFLDLQEYPDEALEELFLANKLLRRRPFKYIFEARASSVSKDSLERLKKYVGKDSRVQIEIGVEVADEWIRNHWLNKGIYNHSIISAVDAIHDAGFEASGNVLIGLPGLTEEQSIKLFKQTIRWLESIGVDHYICLPLNRKERTLQGFLYNNLKNNSCLKELGIAQGEHTGLLWKFTVIEALCSIIRDNPERMHKIEIAQITESQNSINNRIAFNYDSDCTCNAKIENALTAYQSEKSLEKLEAVRRETYNDVCYKMYMELLKKQEKSGDILQTIYQTGKEIAKVLWPDKWQAALKLLENEILVGKILYYSINN